MKKLLVIADPTEGEPLAIEKSLSLSKYDDCSIHIVVFYCVSLTNLSKTAGLPEAELKQSILNSQTEKWQMVLSKYTGQINLSFELIWTKDLVGWIKKHCAETCYDLIVKTGHRSESFLHTPSDWHLLRESPYPVYITSPKQVILKPIVLAAIDVLTDNEEKQRLNKKVLESAFRLSVQTNASMHICYAIKIPKLVKDMDLIDVPRRVHSLSDKAKDHSKSLLVEYQLNENVLHINEGEPGQVIAQISNKLKAQCTVIGTTGRTGIVGKVIGNTCEKALHYVQGDLLVVNNG